MRFPKLFALVGLFLCLFAFNALAVTYEYDDFNRLTKATYDDDSMIVYTYDNAGNRLTQAVTASPGQLAIEVSTSDDYLLGNIHVYAFTAAGKNTGFNSITDADGRAYFDIKVFKPGQYKFRVDYLGGQFWTPLLNIPGTYHYELVIAVETTTVNVLVAGAPQAGVKVYLFNEKGSYLGLSDVTDDQGQVSFDLPIGCTFKFRANTLGSQYWSDPLPIVSNSNPVALVDTGGGVLTLTVQKDASTPLVGLKAYVYNAGGTYLSLNAVTDANGLAAFPLSSGQYKIRIDYLGYKYWTDIVNVQQDLNLTYPIPHQDVNILVETDYNADLTPQAGLKVYLYNSTNTYVGLSQVTDAQGKVTFNLPQQEYRARVDYLTRQYWYDPFIWQDQTLLIPQGLAQVSATELGQPLTGIKIHAFNDAGKSLGLVKTTDQNGEAGFYLPEGQYKFRADFFTNQYWSDLSGVTADMITPIVISTGGGNFTLTVQKDDQIPLIGVKCYLFNANGAYTSQRVNTNSQGQASFNPSNGNYKIRVDYLGYQYWSDAFTIPTNTALTLTIPHQDVSVQVESSYNNDLEPLAGLKVYLFTADSYQGLCQTSDAQGTVHFNLPQQDYLVRIDYLGQQYWSDFFNWTNPIVIINESIAQIYVNQDGTALANVNVYVFSNTGTYLGIKGKTDNSGYINFLIPAGTYNFRADYNGQQYWATADIESDLPYNYVYINTSGGEYGLEWRLFDRLKVKFMM